MHSRDPQKSDADFQAELEKILDTAQSAQEPINQVVDFTRFIFPAAEFSNRKFTAKCMFRSATFTQATDFSKATFTQDANFYLATFTQAADFSNARFTQDADFSNARFTQDANFSNATFTQAANFYVARFTQSANFSRATFTGSANFFAARFTQAANFSWATFTQAANFTGAKFLASAEFRETTFRKDGTRQPSLVFSLAELSHPEAVKFYKTDLSQALFHNCDVSKINFSSVTWCKRKGSRKRMVFEEQVEFEEDAASALKPGSHSSDERDYALIAELYQQLKKNYDDKRDYWTAGDFHYGELEMKRLSSPRKNKFVRGFHRHLGLVAWYKYASQYGESYWRPGLLLIALLLLFAAIFPVFGLQYHAGKGPSNATSAQSAQVLTYKDPYFNGQTDLRPIRDRLRLYGHSFMTALDVAAFQKQFTYEPVYPRGHLLSVFELLLTSTLIALFLLAVQRQFRR